MSKLIPAIEVPVIQKGITSKVNLSSELKKESDYFWSPRAFTPTLFRKTYA